MAILIEAFSTPRCPKCAQARDTLKEIAQEFGENQVTWRDVNLLDEIDYAVELGIVSPPSIAIDHELVFPALPTPDRLRDELKKRVAQASSPAAG